MSLFSTRKFSRTIGLHLAALALSLGALILLTPTQTRAEIHGDALFEMSLGAGLSFPSGDLSNYYDTLGAESGMSLNLSAGYFITELMSVGLAGAYTQFSHDKDTIGNHYRFYSIDAYLKYHFGYEAKATPYVRLQGGLVFANMSTPLTSIPGLGFRELSYDPVLDFSVALGTRYSTSEWSGLYLEVAYHMMSVGGQEQSYQGQVFTLPADAPAIQLTAGFSFDIGPKN